MINTKYTKYINNSR